MRSPKQIFFDYLKQLREQNRLRTPSPQELTHRVTNLVRDTVREMHPIQADHQTMHQMKMLIDSGLNQMVAEHFIYRGGCDTIQIVDGRIKADINVVPIRSVEWITINFSIGEHHALGMEQEWHNPQEWL